MVQAEILFRKGIDKLEQMCYNVIMKESEFGRRFAQINVGDGFPVPFSQMRVMRDGRQAFFLGFIKWLREALKHTSVIVAEGNL